MNDTNNSNINAALADLQTQLPRISKDQTAKVVTKTGSNYQYKYANLTAISEEVLPLLGKLGLSFVSRPTLLDGRFVLVYELRHVSGEQIDGVFPLNQGTPQETGGAITYARRYCLCAVTGVAPDDDDNDAALAEKAAKRRELKESRSQQTAAGDKERGISAEQTREMQMLFQELGITDRTAKVKYAVSVVKRELGSATDLTHTEGDKVVGALKGAVERRNAKQADGTAKDGAPSSEEDPEGWLKSQQPPVGAA